MSWKIRLNEFFYLYMMVDYTPKGTIAARRLSTTIGLPHSTWKWGGKPRTPIVPMSKTNIFYFFPFFSCARRLVHCACSLFVRGFFNLSDFSFYVVLILPLRELKHFMYVAMNRTHVMDPRRTRTPRRTDKYHSLCVYQAPFFLWVLKRE